MSSTESTSGEKQRIFEWAQKYHSDDADFPVKSDQDSYFESFDPQDDAVEYGFSNLVEFKERLLKMWSDMPGRDEIALVCAVAMFKSKPRPITDSHPSDSSEQNEEEFSIPEFVYAF